MSRETEAQEAMSHPNLARTSRPPEVHPQGPIDSSPRGRPHYCKARMANKRLPVNHCQAGGRGGLSVVMIWERRVVID